MVRRLSILISLLCVAGATLASPAGAAVSATDVCAAQPGQASNGCSCAFSFTLTRHHTRR